MSSASICCVLRAGGAWYTDAKLIRRTGAWRPLFLSSMGRRAIHESNLQRKSESRTQILAVFFENLHSDRHGVVSLFFSKTKQHGCFLGYYSGYRPLTTAYFCLLSKRSNQIRFLPLTIPLTL